MAQLLSSRLVATTDIPPYSTREHKSYGFAAVPLLASYVAAHWGLLFPVWLKSRWLGGWSRRDSRCLCCFPSCPPPPPGGLLSPRQRVLRETSVTISVQAYLACPRLELAASEMKLLSKKNSVFVVTCPESRSESPCPATLIQTWFHNNARAAVFAETIPSSYAPYCAF